MKAGFENIDIAVWISLASVYVCLIIATTASWWLISHKEVKGLPYLKLRQNLRVWWYMIVAFTVCTLMGRGGAITFFGFLSYLAFKEYVSLTNQHIVDRRAVFWGYLVIPLQFLWVYYSWYSMFIIFIPIYAFFFIAFRVVLIGNVKHYLNSISTLQWGLMVTAFSLSHVAYCLNLGHNWRQGLYYVLYLLLLTEFNDMGQYYWSREYGRHKISPQINPERTWEGFIGGVATTSLIAIFLGAGLTEFTLIESIGAGITISVSGFFGALTFTAIKMNIGINPDKVFVPVYGGVMERVETLTYSAPLFFHYVYYGVF